MWRQRNNYELKDYKNMLQWRDMGPFVTGQLLTMASEGVLQYFKVHCESA